jgi:hypothetical protein
MATMTPEEWEKTPKDVKDRTAVLGIHLRAINDYRQLAAKTMLDAMIAKPDASTSDLVQMFWHVDDPFTPDEIKRALQDAPPNERGQRAEFFVSVVPRDAFVKACFDWQDGRGGRSYRENGQATIKWKSPDLNGFIVAVASHGRMSIFPLRVVAFDPHEPVGVEEDMTFSRDMEAYVAYQEHVRGADTAENAEEFLRFKASWIEQNDQTFRSRWFANNCVDMPDGRLMTVGAIPQDKAKTRVRLG